jgi:hypothetical protein
VSTSILAQLTALDLRVKALERPIGKPGTGECICKMRPDRDRHRQGYTDDLNSVVDHRCPWHGEKAQPKLWGRHSIKELMVTPEQWRSLGVNYEIQPIEAQP